MKTCLIGVWQIVDLLDQALRWNNTLCSRLHTSADILMVKPQNPVFVNHTSTLRVCVTLSASCAHPNVANWTVNLILPTSSGIIGIRTVSVPLAVRWILTGFPSVPRPAVVQRLGGVSTSCTRACKERRQWIWRGEIWSQPALRPRPLGSCKLCKLLTLAPVFAQRTEDCTPETPTWKPVVWLSWPHQNHLRTD